MGSPGKDIVDAGRVLFHVTGFGRFQGVPSNPTSVIVESLVPYLHTHPLEWGAQLGSATVLETSAEGSYLRLLQMYHEHGILRDPPAEHSSHISTLRGEAVTSFTQHGGLGSLKRQNDTVIWIHLGVDSAAFRFALETQAVNEATFRCPDERGYQPVACPILLERGDCKTILGPDLPVKELCERLQKQGFHCTLSSDAGKFVCNWIYFLSLDLASVIGAHSIFLHVPLFDVFDKEIQLQFVRAVMCEIAKCHVGWRRA